MPKCAHCGTTIAFGGKRLEGLRFCNKDCLEQGRHRIYVDFVPDDLVLEAAEIERQGPCPFCKKRSPVEIHHACRVMSCLVVSLQKEFVFASCRRCATWKQTNQLLLTGFLGWWGIPFGIVFTPVYLCRNIIWLCKRTPDEPSRELIETTRLSLAKEYGADLAASEESPAE